VSSLDLLVSDGIVVTPSGRYHANVGVTGGRIAYIGADRPTSREHISADGLHVLPGGVDTHVHLMDPGDVTREDFPHGTSAAAASGVTTVIEHTHGSPVRNVEDLLAKRDYLHGRSHVDYGLAAHAWPGMAGEVAPLWGAGICFFKVFTCTTHGVAAHDPAALLRHLQSTSAVDAISLVHCEEESLTSAAEYDLRTSGRADGGVIPQWRSREAELTAVAVTSLLVRRTGARAAIAHVSNPEAAAYVAAERQRGARLYAEGCPQYFILRENECLELGALRKFTPPARARGNADEAAMWRLLGSGDLTHISSDHAPSTLEQKTHGDIWEAHFGLPGLDSTMALLLDAAATGQLALEDIARVYSRTPARIYGLWPKKGELQVGADADMALVDVTAHRTLRNEDVRSKARWTPYDGRAVRGSVARTILRGETVSADGSPSQNFTGRFLAGPGAVKT
jgi:dihydroorotase (multifunctional complex type)